MFAFTGIPNHAQKSCRKSAALKFSLPLQRQESTTDSTESKRKPWVKKDAAESMLSLIEKQEQRVAKMRKELEEEEKQLDKLQKAKKILEAS